MKHTYRKSTTTTPGGRQDRKKTSHVLRNTISAIVLGIVGTSTAMAINRVGPVDPVNGFPMFYEDTSGLRLDLCTNLAACFFAPPDPGLPTSFPGNFPDEAFYWAAEAIMSEAGGVNAILVMAREAAFFNEAVIPGDQVVFSRIRLFVDGAPQMGGNTYTITHPYGSQTFISEAGDAGPGVKGPGLSTTADVGITKPLEFTAALNVFPNFLIPTSLANVDGSANLGLLIPGKLFADELNAAGTTTVQGSPNATNFFRIEGPGIHTVYPSYQCQDAGGFVILDCVETGQFAMQGRVSSRHGVDIDKAVYEKVADDPTTAGIIDPITYVSIFAHSVEGQTLGVSVDGGSQILMTEGSGGQYFTSVKQGTDYLMDPTARHPVNAQAINLTDSAPDSINASITDQVSITQSTLDTNTGELFITAQSSNKVDPSQLNFDNFTGNLTDDGAGTSSGIFTIGSAAAVGVPPQSVTIRSLEGGFATRDVEVTGNVTNGGAANLLLANAGPDQNVVSGVIVDLNGSGSIGEITSYSWANPDFTLLFDCAPSTPAPLCSQIVVQATYPAGRSDIPLDILNAVFTLTVTNAAGEIAIDSVTVNVVNPLAVVSDECTIVSAKYRADKDQWRISGASNVTQNQLVSAYVGPIGDTSRLIGQVRVDAIGGWDVRTPRGGAIAIPTAADNAVWIDSELGCQESSPFVSR